MISAIEVFSAVIKLWMEPLFAINAATAGKAEKAIQSRIKVQAHHNQQPGTALNGTALTGER